MKVLEVATEPDDLTWDMIRDMVEFEKKRTLKSTNCSDDDALFMGEIYGEIYGPIGK